MSDTKKCANPTCTCAASKGDKFCGAHCEALDGAVEVVCRCGHPTCRADISAASPAAL